MSDEPSSPVALAECLLRDQEPRSEIPPGVMGEEVPPFVCEACNTNQHVRCIGPECCCECNSRLKPLGKPVPPIPYSRARAAGVFRSLLGFEYIKGEFIGQPQRPFRPMGLIIWGAPEFAVVSHAVIGCDLQVLSSWAPVPTKFFSMGKSYEEVAKLLQEGIEPPAWCDWKTIIVGEQVRLILSQKTPESHTMLGPSNGIELVMWGHQLYS